MAPHEMLWRKPAPSQSDLMHTCVGRDAPSGHTWPPDKAGPPGHPGRHKAPAADLPMPGGCCSEQCWVLQTAGQYPGSQQLLCVTTEQDAMQRGGRVEGAALLYSVTSLGKRRFALCSPLTHILTGWTEVWSHQLLPECKALTVEGGRSSQGVSWPLWNDVNNVSTVNNDWTRGLFLVPDPVCSIGRLNWKSCRICQMYDCM